MSLRQLLDFLGTSVMWVWTSWSQRSLSALRFLSCYFSVAKSCPTLCNSMDCSTLGFPVLQSPRLCSNPCPLSRWCHPTISSSVIPFSSRPQSLQASGSFPMSQFFASGGQRIGVSALELEFHLPMNIQDWFPLGLTGLISLQSKGLSRAFSDTAGQKHQFFGPGSQFHVCVFHVLLHISLWNNMFLIPG